jgi:hypothetical protein
VLLAIVATPGTAPAATYYVATSGANTNSGTSADAAWKTIGCAAGKVVAGDTVYVRGGTYGEIVVISSSGTASQPIQFLAYSGEKPVVDGENRRGAVINVTGAQVTLSGFTVINGGNIGIDFRGSNGIVRNMTVSNIQNTAIYCPGNCNLIESNHVSFACLNNNTPNSRFWGRGGWGVGISVCNQSAGSDKVNRQTIVRGNTVHDIWGEGINTFQVDGAIVENNVVYDTYSTHVYIDTGRNVIVRNNLVYSTTNRIATARTESAHLFSMSDETADKPLSSNNLVVNNLFWNGYFNVFSWTLTRGGGANGVLIANNTLVNTTLWFADEKAANHGTVIQNNIFYHNDGKRFIGLSRSAYDGCGLSFRHNLWSSPPNYPWASGEGDLIGDPRLALAGPTAAGQLTPAYFSVAADSVVHGRGAPVCGVTDKYCITNGVTPLDVGAYPADNPFQCVTNAVTFPLTISNGLGGGHYVAGQTLTISALSRDKNLVFQQWVINSGTPKLANIKGKVTALTMPAGAASITADFSPRTQ